ncbi:MAG: hypothetical protein IH905_11560 [Proteobacteria bacterium]|nr:hypothetical protein [Pseudomonadota bacterium]
MASRLIYCEDTQPGITRSKIRGKWAYWSPEGERITDRDEIDRLNRIGLPPAYKDAWFCPRANGHIQAVGWDDFDEAEAFTVGERISNLLRLVYARRGFKREDELDLSPRFLESTRFGPAEEEGIEPYLPAMLDEYYRYQGWDVATGTPTAETLTRLGMEEFLDDVA